MTSRMFDAKLALPAKTIKHIVKHAKYTRLNRVYYNHECKYDDIRQLGVIQCDKKSAYDQVAVNESNNESIEFYGCDQKGSHFNLSIVITSLYPDVEHLNIESRWRLATISFLYLNAKSGCKYTYSCDQLLDYESKRQNPTKHDVKNVYRIGSMSVETVLPFSFTRILFNGLLTRTTRDAIKELVSAKFTISTHPTCDKFDYKYRFNVDYLCERLKEQIDSGAQSLMAEQLLSEMLEDRLDQTMMFQGCLELLGTESAEKFIMWGAKLKRFLNPLDELAQSGPIKRESLYVWTECGHWIHLTRPLARPSLVYGMINNAYEYASPLYGARLIFLETPDELQQKPVAQRSGFDQLDAFESLKPGCKLIVKGYKIKDFALEVLDINQHGLMRIIMNGFEGWALIGNESAVNLGQQLRSAQNNLWSLSIERERKILDFSKLASEKLLGGKGNSLIELSRLIQTGSLIRDVSMLSVPKGIVVTCMAYRLWLLSDPIILNSIDELDATRRALAARSVCTNPLSDDHMSIGQAQPALREQCLKTSAALKSCPLPSVLKNHLRSMLRHQFTDNELASPADGNDSAGKFFAVRSSAVGEDSLETSAAGQMRTILDAQGFDAICRSIVDCWASQFEMEALFYKSQNGLPLNLPMAVVVQELIACDVAGVAATCDPLKGDKERLEILANPGLGEGVVSGGQADTIRISLGSLGWDAEGECSVQCISLKDAATHIERLNCDKSTCCLTDKQIVCLANLLIKLRNTYDIKDREIEWGITIQKLMKSSSSSSSSSSDEETYENFHVHLLQSRPLTHLNKLSSREIDHELDYGFTCPLDIVSRANLGEVMPGVLCPLTISYFLSVCPNVSPDKPFESDHTHKGYTATSFASYGQLVCMVLTNSDVISKFTIGQENDDLSMRVMVGTTPDPYLKNMKRIQELTRERVHPLSTIKKDGLLKLLALDMGQIQMDIRKHKRSMMNTQLDDDPAFLEATSERLRKLFAVSCSEQSIERSRKASWPLEIKNNPIGAEVRRNIIKLFNRICSSSGSLTNLWRDHMHTTILSMMYNMICIKILEKQAAYSVANGEETNSNAILNDFSILIRGGPKTESGDISHLLEELILALEDEGKMEQAREMNHKELYELLTQKGTSGRNSSSNLYARFMAKNGHRAFKEFDFATPTWADDPSYIIKSLASRLKQHPGGPYRQAVQSRKLAQANKLQTEMDAVLAKVNINRRVLVSYVLPRARNALARREKSKSRIIFAINKYRRAFRQLGGLLCLEGRLPSAELIFQLTIEEVDRVVRGEVGELAALLYKARRRQQRARVLEVAAYPKPVLDFEVMIETVQRFSEPNHNEQAAEAGEHLVRGITSCAGCVTGRACVVSNPDDMDQIQVNDILITYSIDASWSVYFFMLAGIVTEVGGIVSHGAVVAREYGIPTLCTAIGACSKFKTGHIVTLDANQGTCYLAKQQQEANDVGCSSDEGVTSGCQQSTISNRMPDAKQE